MADPLVGLPSAEALIDDARREGFYEFSDRLISQRLTLAYRELFQARDALAAAERRADALEAEANEWREFAFKYGTQSTAERQRATMTLEGRVSIAADLLAKDGAEAIRFVCSGLAKKLVAQLPRANAPTTDGA